MKIKVKFVVSQETNQYTFDLDEYDMTFDDWWNLSEEEKESKLNEWAEQLPEQPYWIVEKFEEKD